MHLLYGVAMRNKTLWILSFAAGMALLTSSVHAATNAGAQLRRYQDETQQQLRQSPTTSAPQETSVFSPSQAAAASSDSLIMVQGLSLTGVSLFSNEQLRDLLAPFNGKQLNTAQIHQVADALMQYYRAAGYFTAKVFIPPQTINDGIISLDVYEGYLEKDGLEVDNQGERIDSQVIQDMLNAELNSDTPLHRNEMERVLLLIEDLPGVRSSATLYPGKAVGTARLRNNISDEPLFSGNIDADNFGSEHSGRERLGTTLYLNSPTQSGDQLVTRLVTSGSDSNYAYLTYLRPISATGTRLGASVDYYDYSTDNIDNLGDADGYASDLSLYLTHPLIRARHSNLNFRGTFNHARIVDNNDLDFNAIREVDSLTLGLEGDEDHDWLANGLTLYGLSLTGGNADLRGNQNARAFNRSGPDADGDFYRLNAYLQRLQHLTGQWALYGNLSGQLASGNLDTSQKYYLGGPTSMAGYPPGEVGGDSAVEMHLELRYDFAQPMLNGALQAEVFYQKGWLKQHQDPWSGWQGNNSGLDNEVTLDAIGVGFTQTLQDQWLVRGLIGWQTSDSPVRDPITRENTDGIDDDYRVWMQVVHYF
jgi:hemolysin activation/secretion protein